MSALSCTTTKSACHNMVVVFELISTLEGLRGADEFLSSRVHSQKMLKLGIRSKQTVFNRDLCVETDPSELSPRNYSLEGMYRM